MKKLSLILAIILAFTLTACTESKTAGTPQSTPEPQQSESLSGENEETPEASPEDTEEPEETTSETAEDTDAEGSGENEETDPFDPAENIEFDSEEEYQQYLSGLDSEGEISSEEITAFLSEKYKSAYDIASFCRSLGPDTLDIGVDNDNTVVITGNDGISYECAPTDLSSIEEFWAYVSEYFSAATLEQLKNATADYLLYEADGVLYVAIGARGNNYWYDPDTIEIVRQTGDRATVSIVKSYFIEGEESIALRDLVKEDGQWKFDFIM